MAKPLILGTGLSGLVGSTLVEQLGDRYEFLNLDLTQGVDILDEDSVARALDGTSARALIHCAAFTDANAAQAQNGDTAGTAYRVNVEGTRIIAEACARNGIHLIHISTGYVYNGQKTTAYSETDPTNPSEWYGITKAKAEEVVASKTPSATILRINFPFRQTPFPKLDIWHKMEQALKEGKRGPFFSDHFFTLTPLEWFSQVMAWVIETRPAGIFHATSSTAYSDHSLAQKIAVTLNISEELATSSVHEYNQTAARPYQPSLILGNTKLQTAMGAQYPAETA